MKIETMVEATVTAEREALERLGEEIAVLSAHLSVATARLLVMIRDFDTREGWGEAGARSCAEWLSWRVSMDIGAAREHVRVARALPALPRIDAAYAAGELSYSKVRALTRVATVETEARLLTFARSGTASHVERLVRGWRRVDRNAENKEAVQRQRNRSLRVYPDADGMVVVEGRLTPEAGAVVRRALEAACDRLYGKGPLNSEGEVPSFAQRYADGLAMIAEAALHHKLDPGAPGERYQVVVHVDAPALADPDQPGESVLEDGDHVSAETSRRLACDATRVIMRHGPDGDVTEVGARTRTVPPALRRVLQQRDRGCRFPGCGLRFTQAHHIEHWAAGGPTTVSNLALLCRRHHRSVHEDGFDVERLANGALEFRRPDGRPLPEAPRLPAVPVGAVESLREQNVGDGVEVDGHTLTPDWDGTSLNVGYAISVLHPLALRSS